MTTVRPSIFAGPALSFNLLAKDELVNTAVIEFLGIVRQPNISNVNRTGLSLIMGGEIQFHLGNREVVLEVRFSQSLKNTFDNVDPNDIPYFQSPEFPKEIPIVSAAGEAPDLKNRAVTFSLGLAF